MIERYIVGKNQKVSLELISLKLVKGLHKYIFKNVDFIEGKFSFESFYRALCEIP